VPDELFSLAPGRLEGENASARADLFGSNKGVKTMMGTDIYDDDTRPEESPNKLDFRIFETPENYGNATKVILREPPNPKGQLYRQRDERKPLQPDVLN